MQTAYPSPPIQFVPDPEEHPPPCNDNGADEQPSTSKTSTVRETVDNVIHNVIDPQDTQGSQSKNTFLSAAIPLSHRVSEKVKNQIWANEYADFALLLHSSVSNATDERYIVKLEPNKGGQPSLVLAPNTKRQTLHSID